MTESWASPIGGDALIAGEYDAHDEMMLRLYALGKQRQWDADVRLDWDSEVDPDNPLGMPDSFIWIADSDLWDKLPERERIQLRRHTAAWTSAQLLHGEQLGLFAVTKVAMTVPDLDSKLFAATQIMDEARHTEAFNRYISTKIGIRYPLTGALSTIFGDILRDDRWDMCALAVQILIENLAMATFTLRREHTTEPLTKAMTTYIMQDEARHVAFGRIMLRHYYRDLTPAERHEREDFVVEASWALRDAFIGESVWQNLDYGYDECMALARVSPALRQYRRKLFMRIVPALKDIGMFGQRVQDALEKMGVLGFANLDPVTMPELDDAAMVELDRRERAARRAEIDGVIALGESG